MSKHLLVVFSSQTKVVNLTDVQHHVEKCCTSLAHLKGGKGKNVMGLKDYIADLTLERAEFSELLLSSFIPEVGI